MDRSIDCVVVPCVWLGPLFVSILGPMLMADWFLIWPFVFVVSLLVRALLIRVLLLSETILITVLLPRWWPI